MILNWLYPAFKTWDQLSKNLSHAILIQAGEGYGVFEFAQGVAQALLCERRPVGGEACGVCAACNWFGLGNHPDFRLVVPDSMAADTPAEGEEPAKKEKRSEQIRIEQVRALADFLAVGTHRGGARVILIYPADAMNLNTQNALLKNLEEPPPATVFLLATSQPDRLLPTVRSRCLKFALPLPDPKQVSRCLEEQGIEHPEAALAGVGGAPLIALKAAETEADRERFLEGLRNPRFDPIGLAESIQRIPLWDVVGWLQRWSYDLLLSRLAGRVRYHVNHEGVISDTSSHCKAEDIAGYLRRLAQARSLARHPLNSKLFVEDLLLHYQRMILRA